MSALVLFGVFSSLADRDQDVERDLGEFASGIATLQGIIDVHVGPTTARGTVAQGITHALVVTFEDRSALERYLASPVLQDLRTRLDRSTSGQTAFLLARDG